MRQPSSRSTQRRHIRTLHPVGDRIARVRLALRRLLATPTARRLLVGGIGTLALLVGMGATGGAQTPNASVADAAPAPHPFMGRAQPPSKVPDVGHWVDPTNQTAYTVQLHTVGRKLAGLFVYQLPNGDQIRGQTALQLQPDTTSTQQASSSSGACALGALAMAKVTASPQAVAAAQKNPNIADTGTAEAVLTTPVAYDLTAHVDQFGLTAYAGLSYALTTDQPGVAAVCAGGPPTYQMNAGCTPVTCVDVMATAAPSLAKHDGAVLKGAAANNRAGWQDAYKASSRLLTAQLSSDQFADALIAQQHSKGKITSISPITSPPAIDYDTAGQAYFEETQTVTLDRNGTKSTLQVTSYYVLEAGAWMFWYSV